MKIKIVKELDDVSLWCKCGTDCMLIDGGKSKDSVMWTHQNVAIKLRDEIIDCEIEGDVDGDPKEDYVDILLSCGCVIGYVPLDHITIIEK